MVTTALNETEQSNVTVWDTKTQAFHGGQEHRFLNNFVQDFSVTTNYLGTPRKALEAAKDAINEIHHYPAADQEPAKSCLAEFLWGTEYKKHHARLLLGNGASELIDLVIRKALETFHKFNEPNNGQKKPTWKGGPWNVQYREYQRSAETHGLDIKDPSFHDRADVLCVVNPCNPTGDYLSIHQLKEWIRDNVNPGGCVIVDESMQPWHSSEFRHDSLITQHDYIEEMYTHYGVSVHVMHSWTKIWSCTGLRVGSVICPTAQHCEALRKIAVPWSVNGPALKFVEQVVKDTDYLEETWLKTKPLRAYLIHQLKSLGYENWDYHGEPFLSWVWLDMKNEERAEKAVDLARKAGVPVRSGKPGYQCNTFVRIAVRREKEVQVLMDAWKSL
ncbi:pyridoxal phosphate-dependent transferase [Mycotypha africana]|uniref:pyridoxal phosphate-dependent transferase n=1 Tax=Mycotypha africana TaxID=64632 RepID=UPI002301355A|nr:pyridoxal phosphate-dependent transferase [Mycotypha africana]KAI8973383.1 pyridoxal phosphate-dependent transferase [Mycotypha africana]